MLCYGHFAKPLFPPSENGEKRFLLFFVPSREHQNELLKAPLFRKSAENFPSASSSAETVEEKHEDYYRKKRDLDDPSVSGRRTLRRPGFGLRLFAGREDLLLFERHPLDTRITEISVGHILKGERLGFR